MGYADFGNFKVLDGYQLNSTDGYSVTSPWVDIHSAPFFDVTCVFTGGSPAGTLTLQKSNDLQWEGGNRPQPRASSPNAPYVSDAVNAPTGFGTVSASVSGAGVYNLNQYYVGYRWFRVVYSASANVVTQLDIFCNWKK